MMIKRCSLRASFFVCLYVRSDRQADGVESAVQQVDEEKFSGQGGIASEDDLDGFRSLDGTDDAGQRPDDPQRLAEVRYAVVVFVQIPVGGTSPVVEHGHLPLELADAAVHKRFAGSHTGVVDDVAGSQVISCIYYDVICRNDLRGIRSGQAFVVCVDGAVRIEGL